MPYAINLLFFYKFYLIKLIFFIKIEYRDVKEMRFRYCRVSKLFIYSRVELGV